VYWPLEIPDLFLGFVRLYDTPDFERAALEWVRKYGLPGEVGYKRFEGIVGGFPDRMLVSDIREDVRRARLTLLLYEAVLNRDENAALRLMSPERADNVLEQAMTLAKSTVNVVVGDCKPMLSPVHPHSLEVKSTWDFETLLGAMYLQMYWLMVLGGNVARCEYERCGKIISYTRPHPEGRKPRQDKRFCNDACRQAHHRSKSKS